MRQLGGSWAAVEWQLCGSCFLQTFVAGVSYVCRWVLAGVDFGAFCPTAGTLREQTHTCSNNIANACRSRLIALQNAGVEIKSNAHIGFASGRGNPVSFLFRFLFLCRQLTDAILQQPEACTPLHPPHLILARLPDPGHQN